MRELGQEYFEFEKGKGKSIDTEKLAKEIQKKNVGVDENNALLIAEEVSNRVSRYDNAYFKAWNVLVALGIGIVAFLLPVWILKFKRKVSEMRKQEEVIMFQTLMMILMHTTEITSHITKTICNFADQRHFSTSVLATHTFLLLHQSFWQNSILSSFGPLIMKNFTPLSQNGSCSIPSVMTSYPFSQIFLYISSISLTSSATC